MIKPNAKKSSVKKPAPKKTTRPAAKKISSQAIDAMMAQMQQPQQPDPMMQPAVPVTSVPGLPPFVAKKKKGK